MHEKHRERVRVRYIKEGIDAFESHQILELLLFYAIPRKDTNELAHRLLDKFGSLSNVLDTPADELMQIEGIGENAAVLLSLVPQVFRKYYIDKFSAKTVIRTTEDAGAFVKNLFVGRVYESCFVICLNSQNKVIHTEMISEGTIDETPVYPRNILQIALRCNAYSIILAHNHPGGSITPSKSDIDATNIIYNALNTVNIELKDHIVVANDDYFSFRDMKFLK